ncbi:hypothetical protein CEK26_000230 [Fusarium fujikuroi]|nr:hypothetical protein CEK27_000227 [Fusarium fujikuroi]QGI75320.1 hypothetical protein CEK25_000226 [Fusarium fujikuroi]QGI89015.1 hypothetical protein CEK26_000230 [Fusarium fujikuroi]VTT74982.1 unnamed protein product [Fusarium fujikuroi]VZH90847.1 unnamed protein product [Fusarium fujikuroi]
MVRDILYENFTLPLFKFQPEDSGRSASKGYLPSSQKRKRPQVEHDEQESDIISPWAETLKAMSQKMAAMARLSQGPSKEPSSRNEKYYGCDALDTASETHLRKKKENYRDIIRDIGLNIFPALSGHHMNLLAIQSLMGLQRADLLLLASSSGSSTTMGCVKPLPTFIETGAFHCLQRPKSPNILYISEQNNAEVVLFITLEIIKAHHLVEEQGEGKWLQPLKHTLGETLYEQIVQAGLLD